MDNAMDYVATTMDLLAVDPALREALTLEAARQAGTVAVKLEENEFTKKVAHATHGWGPQYMCCAGYR